MNKAKLGNFEINFNNSEEYHHLKQELFTYDAYYFETDNAQPVIIDAGAHIGLATLYFKRLFRGARITAIEPLPQNFALLEKNIWENQLDDVTAVHAALSDQRGDQILYFDETKEQWWSTASFIKGAWTEQQDSQQITIPVVPLADFLDQPVDLLKMDIEGAEQRVLTKAGDRLKNVKKMFIEFHHHPSQKLPNLLEFLEELGFEIELWKKGKPIKIREASGLVLIEATQH